MISLHYLSHSEYSKALNIYHFGYICINTLLLVVVVIDSINLFPAIKICRNRFACYDCVAFLDSTLYMLPAYFKTIVFIRYNQLCFREFVNIALFRQDKFYSFCPAKLFSLFRSTRASVHSVFLFSSLRCRTAITLS